MGKEAWRRKADRGEGGGGGVKGKLSTASHRVGSVHGDKKLRVGGSAGHRFGSMHGDRKVRVGGSASHRLGSVHGDRKLRVGGSWGQPDTG